MAAPAIQTNLLLGPSAQVDLPIVVDPSEKLSFAQVATVRVLVQRMLDSRRYVDSFGDWRSLSLQCCVN